MTLIQLLTYQVLTLFNKLVISPLIGYKVPGLNPSWGPFCMEFVLSLQVLQLLPTMHGRLID